MGRVEGKVAFVTGAGRGQGRSHAVRLAKEGADIIAIDICGQVGGLEYALSTPEDLAETARMVEALDRRIITFQADIRDAEALKEAADQGAAEFGKIDIVVGNAAISYISEWQDVTADMWKDTIDVNLTGTFNTVMATAPHLIEAGGGSIILTSSSSAVKAYPFLVPYVSSKAGVIGLAQAFASELAEHKIRVNTILPTGVKTPMGGGADVAGQIFQPLIEAHPRLSGIFTNLLDVDALEPEDISDAVLFLASDEAKYITATTLPVDAGLTKY